jgi:hypothetical protein
METATCVLCSGVGALAVLAVLALALGVHSSAANTVLLTRN